MSPNVSNPKHDASEGKRTVAQLAQSLDGDPRRTELAADRNVFAAERTYAAWVRTGLAALASGIGAKPLLAGVVPEWTIWGAGAVLVIFSVFCFAAGIWRELSPGPPPEPDARRIASGS